MAQSPAASDETNAAPDSRLSGLGSLLTGQVFNRALGLGKLLLFAPLLGPEAFGAFRLAAVASSIISALAGLGLYTSFLRFLPEIKSLVLARKFTLRITALSVSCTLLAAGGMILLCDQATEWIFSEAKYKTMTLLIAASLPILILFRCGVGSVQGLGDFRRSATGEVIQNTVHLTFALMLFFIGMRTSEVAFATLLAGSVFALFWLWPRIISLPKSPAGDGELSPYVSRAMRYSMWYAVIPLFQYIFDFIDRWALAHYVNMSTTGAYSVVPLIAGGMIVIGSPLSTIAFRNGAALRANGDDAGARRLVWGASAIALIGSLVYACAIRLLEPTIWWAAGKEYAEAKIVMPLFLTYFTLFNIYYIIGSIAGFREATWVHLISLTFGAIANIILNLLWVPRFGMIGAAWATLIGLIITTSGHVIYILVNRQAMPGRMSLVLLAPAIVLSPIYLLIVTTIALMIISWKKEWILTTHDRELIRSWIDTVSQQTKQANAK